MACRNLKNSSIPLLGWIYVIILLFTGAFGAICLKGISSAPAPAYPGGPPESTSHPFCNALLMFIGEFACLGVYFIMEAMRKRKGRPRPDCPPRKKPFRFWPHTFLFLVPTVVDLISSSLFNMSLYYIPVSIQQMLRNFNVIFVALFSLMFWKDYRAQFDLPHGLGMLMIALGCMIISIATLVWEEAPDPGASSNTPLGIGLTFLGTVFNAFFYVSEEIFLRKVFTTGTMGVANEGGWGIVLFAILLPIFNVVQDPASPTNSVIENVTGWAYQMRTSAVMLVCSIFYIIFTLTYNWSGMEVTNIVSAAARSTFIACRTIIIWIMSFIIGWEKWHTGRTLTTLLGFVFVILGALIYNNVVKIIPYLRKCNIEKYGRWLGRKPLYATQKISMSSMADKEQSLLVSGDSY